MDAIAPACDSTATAIRVAPASSTFSTSLFTGTAPAARSPRQAAEISVIVPQSRVDGAPVTAPPRFSAGRVPGAPDRSHPVGLEDQSEASTGGTGGRAESLSIGGLCVSPHTARPASRDPLQGLAPDQILEQDPGPPDHRGRHARELGHVDAVQIGPSRRG